MLRNPAQFWCLLCLNPVTVKSVPFPTWRTAALMFALAPMARIVCALQLLIMQQHVLGKMFWSSGENPTCAVSEMLLKITCFPFLGGISCRCWMIYLEWDDFCTLPNISYRNVERIHLSSGPTTMQELFAKTVQQWGRNCHLRSLKILTGFPFSAAFKFQLLIWKLFACPRVGISKRFVVM